MRGGRSEEKGCFGQLRIKEGLKRQRRGMTGRRFVDSVRGKGSSGGFKKKTLFAKEGSRGNYPQEDPSAGRKKL